MTDGDLLLAVDLQNVYGPGGAWACRDAAGAAERVLQILSAGAAEQVLFTRFLPETAPTGVWMDYNRINAGINADPWANGMLPSLSEALQKWPLVTKHRYSCLSARQVQDAVRTADRVVLAGVVAECCVLSTALALIDEGVSVIWLTDAISGISAETERAAWTALEGLSPLHIRAMTTRAYIREKRQAKGLRDSEEK